MATDAPAASRASASPLPIPRVPPVIAATFPVRSIKFFPLFLIVFCICSGSGFRRPGPTAHEFVSRDFPTVGCPHQISQVGRPECHGRPGLVFQIVQGLDIGSCRRPVTVNPRHYRCHVMLGFSKCCEFSLYGCHPDISTRQRATTEPDYLGIISEAGSIHRQIAVVDAGSIAQKHILYGDSILCEHV